MALDFLSGIGSLISAGSSVAGMLSRDREPEGYGLAVEQNRRFADLSDALTNGSNPTFVRMRDEEKVRARDALTQSINEIIQRNRRAITRGPVGVFGNQDRRDEAISRALTQGYQDEDYRAGNKARDLILRAMGGASQGMTAGASLGRFSNELGFQNAGQIAGIGRMVGEGVKNIPDLFNFRNNDANAMSGLGAGAPSTTINEPQWSPGGMGGSNRYFG